MGQLQNAVNESVMAVGRASYYGGRYEHGYSTRKMKLAKKNLDDQISAKRQQLDVAKLRSEYLKGILTKGIDVEGGKTDGTAKATERR
jgi:hypothetical protein